MPTVPYNTAALLISCVDAHRQASKRSRTHTQPSSLSPEITQTVIILHVYTKSQLSKN